MPVQMMFERHPSTDQEHTFKFVLMNILFLGPKHHLGQVFYSKESYLKLPFMAAIQITEVTWA